jgi:uncharacterized membrane protein HdeD (DUF308 family)
VKHSALPPVIRDAVLLGLGTFMLIWPVVTNNVNPWLVGAALGVLGIPTGISLKRLSDGKQETLPTPPSSPESVSPSSSQPS